MGPSDGLKIIEKDLRKDCADISLSAMISALFCFEFSNEYDWIVNKRYCKIDGDAINDKRRLMNL